MSRRVGSARAANTRESRSSVTTHLLLIVSNRLVDNDCTLVSTCRQPSGCPGVTGRTHDQPEHLMVPAHRERAGAGAGGPGPRAERNQAVSGDEPDPAHPRRPDPAQVQPSARQKSHLPLRRWLFWRAARRPTQWRCQVHCSRKPPQVEVRGFEPLTPCLPSDYPGCLSLEIVALTCASANDHLRM